MKKAHLLAAYMPIAPIKRPDSFAGGTTENYLEIETTILALLIGLAQLHPEQQQNKD